MLQHDIVLTVGPQSKEGRCLYITFRIFNKSDYHSRMQDLAEGELIFDTDMSSKDINEIAQKPVSFVALLDSSR
jgi:hypothetical protein